ncbi:hypothetical protein TNCV_1263071 [Trichonephila clavipes]|nr:hypothetical protein TNCV_1263071 [Trichonephila clavipes]
MTSQLYWTHQQQYLQMFIKVDNTIRKNPTVGDLAIMAVTEPNPQVRSSGCGMPHPATPVQKHRNAPEFHHGPSV